MALNTKRPQPRKRSEAEEDAAFERVVGAAPDAPAKPKPGPKAGRATVSGSRPRMPAGASSR